MSQRSKQAPSNWSAYEHGRQSSVGSLDSIDENQSQHSYRETSNLSAPRQSHGPSPLQDGEQNLRNRRSSVFDSLRQMGGVNNIDNFARSFQRAAGFQQRRIPPNRRSSVSYDDDGEDTDTVTTPARSLPNRSLLRQQFEAAQNSTPEMAITEAPTERPEQTEPTESTSLLRVRSRTASNPFLARSRSGGEVGAELGTSYGSISSRLTGVAQRRASILIQEHIEATLRARELGEDTEEYKDNVLDHHVEIETREDGEVVERIVGESTVPMTIFNSINVLIGVGILALPLAFRYTGWVIGIALLTLPALLTNYTAKLLAKCLDTNSGTSTFGDLAFLAFGDVGKAIVEVVFIVELFGGVMAMLILFGDTMHSLLPSVGNLVWKSILAVALLPLNFFPFRLLSVTSVLGIFCTLTIVVLVLGDGFVKPDSPGSLLQFSKTYAFPQDWRHVPLSIGLFVAPWGGHSVFPNIYKDMRHPQKYNKSLRSTYAFTYTLDLIMAVFGYLMFGNVVMDEITKNIIASDAYPRALSVVIVILIAAIPITKIPLTTRPIMDTINKKMGVDVRSMEAKDRIASEKSFKHRSVRAVIGILTNIIALGLTILVPEFDSIMATLGSSVCLTICVILPILFYLQIFSAEAKTITKSERILDYVLIAITAVFAVAGTVAGILPKETLGAKSCSGFACLG